MIEKKLIKVHEKDFILKEVVVISLNEPISAVGIHLCAS